jgi:O-antigen/teichoic acid export membrane protein
LILLAIGFFFNCLAHVPMAAMLGLGRPDVRAKVDIAEAFVFSSASYGMIILAGIMGAAIVKAAVLGLDVIVMFFLVKRIMNVGMRSLVPVDLKYFSMTSLGFLAIGLFLDVSSAPFAVRLVSFLVLCSSFVYVFIKKFLRADELAMALSFGRPSNRS